MLIIVLLAVIGLAAILLFNVDNPIVGGICATVGVVAVIALLCVCVVYLINRADAIDDMARITALRRVVGSVDPASAHDVYGQASEYNQKIAANRMWRGVWWARDIMPAQWDTVETIELPRYVSPRALRGEGAAH